MNALLNRPSMHDPITFSPPGDFDLARFIHAPGNPYTLKKEPARTETLRFYDTFDWRLFNKSLVLVQSGDRLCLRKLYGSETIVSVGVTAPPVLIAEFPDSKLKEQLLPILGVRALLKLVEIRTRSRSYAFMDPEGKTVLRLVYEKLRFLHLPHAPVPATYLRLQPIKGYSRHSQDMARRFEQAGLTAATADDIYLKGLQAAGKNPGSYSSKITLTLEPDKRADEAAKIILRFLLQVIRVNAANIEKDIDTEFIHDFRVAVRRTRSALGQIRSVFPPKTTGRFKKDFAFIGKLSNELRDLDVYLLKEDAYKAKIGPVLRNDIEPLFDYLRKKRSEAFQRVVYGLKSKRYSKVIKDWETFLHKPPPASPAAVNAKLPIIILARKRIYKKYRSVVKSGRQILANSDDQMLHVLRIHCKKLRYLMEFFASLFPPEKMDCLIGQLKRLQDNLGDFNDLRIQEEHLLMVARQLPVNRGHSEKIYLAIGSLVGVLGRDRQTIKNAFAETFADFAAAANRELFKDLFTEKPLRSES